MTHIKMRCMLLLSLAFSSGLAVEAADNTESLLKAAIVYNITRFVTWPETSLESNRDSLTMCIAEDNQLVSAFTGFADTQLEDNAFQIRLVTSFEALDAGCHIAFLSEDDLDQVDLDAAARNAILTVSDTEGFADRGGAIELQRVGRKIGFSVNRLIEELSDVSLSSKILQLAERVR